MSTEPPTVFISYSHETDLHNKSVKRLADRLTSDGINVVFDQYVRSPAEGWPRWCAQQIEDADFVIMVCTSTYKRCVCSKMESTKKGVAWEARIIYQLMFDAGSISDKFVPIIFSNASTKDIPTAVGGNSWYKVDNEESYRLLCDRLLGKKPERPDLTGTSAKGTFIKKYGGILCDERIVAADLDEEYEAKLLCSIRRQFAAGENYSAVQAYLWLSDYYHLMDEYGKSLSAFKKARTLARRADIDLQEPLANTNISYSHILVHLNKLEDAKRECVKAIKSASHPRILARETYRLGEILLFQGSFDSAMEKLDEAVGLCNKYGGARDARMEQTLADAYRRKGTTHRMRNELDRAGACYDVARKRYEEAGGWRGRVWLLHGEAELLRAKGVLGSSMERYKKAMKASFRALNVNRAAHAMLGVAEIHRRKGNFEECQHNLAQAMSIYRAINSLWGVAHVRISEALTGGGTNDKAAVEVKLKEALEICGRCGFTYEEGFIRRIVGGYEEQPRQFTFF